MELAEQAAKRKVNGTGKTTGARPQRTDVDFGRQGQATFFPRIPVEFKVENTTQHYHIPLLLSPFGYSTYRGN